MRHITLVEDDPKLANLVQSFLQQHGFQVSIIDTGLNAAEQIIEQQPDLLLLDVMLPELDGFSICREIRQQYQRPVLFLTAKDNPIDHVMGLEIGADDYIIKPIDPHVLLARINAALRRNQKHSDHSSNKLSFDALEINRNNRKVTLYGEEIDLTSHEFELLWLLAKNAGEPVSRDHIHQTMIGREYDGLDRTVDVRVSRLRKKLQDDSEHPIRLRTVWGKGYMLCPDAWSTQQVVEKAE